MNENTTETGPAWPLSPSRPPALPRSAPQSRRTRTMAVRTPGSGGREPLPFADALSRMVAERG